MARSAVRRRLAPEARRDLILDAAARVVGEEGVSAVSMERLSVEAGVSKALVYAYFGNRVTLLGDLLVREYPAFRNTEGMPVDAERSFEDIVRETTAAYLDHVVAKGILLQRLMSEPSVAAAVSEKNVLGREVTARYFGAQMALDHRIPLERAVLVADILMGVTGAAGDLLVRERPDRDRLADLVVQIILAAVREVERGGSDRQPPTGARP